MHTELDRELQKTSKWWLGFYDLARRSDNQIFLSVEHKTPTMCFHSTEVKAHLQLTYFSKYKASEMNRKKSEEWNNTGQAGSLRQVKCRGNWLLLSVNGYELNLLIVAVVKLFEWLLQYVRKCFFTGERLVDTSRTELLERRYKKGTAWIEVSVEHFPVIHQAYHTAVKSTQLLLICN